MTVFLVTNLLAYQFDDSLPEKQSRARDVFVSSATEAVISTQVLIELHSVLTRKLGRTRTDAARVLDALPLDVVSTELWTEDFTHGSSFRGVRIVNPLRSS